MNQEQLMALFEEVGPQNALILMQLGRELPDEEYKQITQVLQQMAQQQQGGQQGGGGEQQGRDNVFG